MFAISEVKAVDPVVLDLVKMSNSPLNAVAVDETARAVPVVREFAVIGKALPVVSEELTSVLPVTVMVPVVPLSTTASKVLVPSVMFKVPVLPITIEGVAEVKVIEASP